jgi:hypothetical protein
MIIAAPALDAEKERESRLRRAAQRQNLSLHRSRRDGTYCLVDPHSNCLAVWGSPDGFGLSLDEIEQALAEGE